jgi:hypothetical protein
MTMLAVAVLLVASTSVVAGPAGAASGPPTQPGSATAGSTVLGVVPFMSGLNLAVSVGQANAAYEGDEAQGSSANINLGGLGTILAETAVCGSTLLKTSELPTPLTASSSGGAQTVTNGTSVGQEAVTTDDDPESASAATTPAGIDLGGLASVSAYAKSTVVYVKNTEQEADASVSEDITLLGGLVTLSGLKWTASQHTGTTAVSTSSFSIGSVTINPGLGSPVAVPVTLSGNQSASQLASAINQVLAVIGVNLTLPESSTDPNTGTVSIGPLQVSFSGSALDNKIANLTLGPTVPALETALFAHAVVSNSCQNLPEVLGGFKGSTGTILGLSTAILEGSGGLNLDFGGANADTEGAPDYANPFGDGGNPLGGGSTSLPGGLGGGGSGGSVSVPATLGTTGAGTSPIGTDGSTGTQPQLGTAGSTAPATTPTASGTQPAAVNPVGLVRCVTTSPAGKGPSCWSGLGALAGVLAAGTGAAVLYADVRYGRRARRRARRKVVA